MFPQPESKLPPDWQVLTREMLSQLRPYFYGEHSLQYQALHSEYRFHPKKLSHQRDLFYQACGIASFDVKAKYQKLLSRHASMSAFCTDGESTRTDSTHQVTSQ